MKLAISPKAWAWLPALLASLLMAVAVGAMVFVIMDRRYGDDFDAAVQSGVDNHIAEMASAPQGAPPATVSAAPVEMETLQDRIALVGRLHEVRRVVVSTQVEGRVEEVMVDIGDSVAVGQTVLARVDDIWAQLALEEAQADLQATQARSQKSSRELAHLEQLAQRGASDPRATDDARSLAEADAAAVLSATAALHRAEEAVSRIAIVAPFDGLVTQKLAEVGQWLDVGDDVVEIVSRGMIDAHIDIPERYVGAVELGMAVDIVVEPLSQTFTGEVVSVDPDGSNAARTFVVKVRLPDEAGALKVGMSVVAHVPISAMADCLTVPRDAVSYSDLGAKVWMLWSMPGSAPDAMPLARTMDVEVLFGVGDRLAVRPLPKMPGLTLEAGSQVVTRGAEMIVPMCPLIVVPTTAPGEEQTSPGPETADPSGH